MCSQLSADRQGFSCALRRVNQMVKIIVILLVIWVIFSIVGFVIEGLLWLAAIGIVLFFATLVWGWLKRKAGTDRS